MAAMLTVAWDGTPPSDKAEWVWILRDVLAGEVGAYRVVFRRARGGWRFTLEFREDERSRDEALVANSPESVAYNIYASLADGGKPVDPTWKPGVA
jgi:hypothetical protein